jgi:hypothetical protein
MEGLEALSGDDNSQQEDKDKYLKQAQKIMAN